jgi:PBP1b-binding outer membrane lipoprotein LpoB
MKVLFFVIASILLLEGCGKKSDPKYQAKNKKIIIILS